VGHLPGMLQELAVPESRFWSCRSPRFQPHSPVSTAMFAQARKSPRMGDKPRWHRFGAVQNVNSFTHPSLPKAYSLERGRIFGHMRPAFPGPANIWYPHDSYAHTSPDEIRWLRVFGRFCIVLVRSELCLAGLDSLKRAKRDLLGLAGSDTVNDAVAARPKYARLPLLQRRRDSYPQRAAHCAARVRAHRAIGCPRATLAAI
jgi:hypothetical protein